MDTWTITKFIDDGTIEAIPSTWINGGKCSWPLLIRDKVANAIKMCEPPNKSWPTHDIITFRNATFDDYNQAKKAAKLAQEINDLSPDSESCKKQRKISKIFSNRDSSLNDSLLPTPPQIATHSTSNRMLSENKVPNASRKCKPPNKSGPPQEPMVFYDYNEARMAAKLIAEMTGKPLRTESKKRKRTSNISSSSDDSQN